MKLLYLKAGQWFVRHWQARAREVGIPKAIGLMRKQGVPLELCMPVLNVGPLEPEPPPPPDPDPPRSLLVRFIHALKGQP